MAITKITSSLIADSAVTASKISGLTTSSVSEGSNQYHTTARARGAVSVTDSGGDGSLSYNSTSGVITYTGPSASETRAHFSAGTGVAISSGAISIGQSVATDATPTFGNTTLTGYLRGPSTFTIDPAAHGDNTGTVVIAGNLQVDGTTTTINSTTLTVDDLNIVLASGAANAAAADGAGITVDTANATITYNATDDDWEFNKPIAMPDGTNISIGAGEDLELFHTGSNSIIHNKTGQLRVRANNLALQSYGNEETYITATENGSVDLYYDNSKVFETASGGVSVTGEITGTSHINLADSANVRIGDGNDLRLFHNASDSFIVNYTGTLVLRNNADDDDVLISTDDGSGSTTDYLRADGSTGSVILYHYGTEKLKTTAGGIQLTRANVADETPLIVLSGPQGIIKLGDGQATQGGPHGIQFDYYNATTSATDGMSMYYRTDPEHISFESSSGTSGTKRMVIERGGGVGIGTDDPSDNLEVASSLATIRLTDTDGGYTRVRSNGGNLILQADEGATIADSSIQFHVDGDEKTRIDSSGNVGIGTISPDSEIHISSATTSAKIIIENASSPRQNYIGMASTDNLEIAADEDNNGADSSIRFRVDADEKMRINAAGKVDIGNTGGLYGKLTVTQSSGADNDEGGIGIVDSSNGRSMRLYCSSTTSFINSGDGGGQTLVLNEGGGNVGIGTNSAGALLDVNDTTSSDNKTIAIFEGQGINTSQASGGQYVAITRTGPISNSSGNVTGGLMLANGTSITGAQCGIRGTYEFSNGRDLQLFTSSDNTSAPTNKMVIKGDGRTWLGGQLTVNNIAGVDAESELTVYGNGRNLLVLQVDDNTLDRGISWRNSGNAYVAQLYITDAGGNLGDMVFGVSDGTETDNTNVEERMRITSDGYVAIGSSTANKIVNFADPNQGGEALKLHFEASSSADKWGIYSYDRTNSHYANMSLGQNAIWINGSNSNVGIGDTSPITDLTVGGNVNGRVGVHIYNTNTGGNSAYSQLNLGHEQGGFTGGYISHHQDGVMKVWNRDSIAMLFGVNDAESMRLDSEGRLSVGYGTTTVTQQGTGDPLFVQGRGTSSAQKTILHLRHYQTQDQTASMTADIDFSLWDSNSNTGLNVPQARIGATGDDTGSQNDEQGGRLSFYVATPSYGSATLTKRGEFVAEAGGDFYTNDGTVSSLSDVRVKTDINSLTDGLEVVKQLRPVTYKYNNNSDSRDTGQLGDADDKVRYGFIADEVQAIAPQYVHEGIGYVNNELVNDFKSLSMTRMIPMLTKALQEANAKIEALEARIDELEG